MVVGRSVDFRFCYCYLPTFKEIIARKRHNSAYDSVGNFHNVNNSIVIMMTMVIMETTTVLAKEESDYYCYTRQDLLCSGDVRIMVVM